MKKILLTLFTVLSVISANAECRRDTIYVVEKYNDEVTNRSKYVNEYDGKSRIINSIKYAWNKNTNQYYLSSKDSTSYNANGYVTEKLRQTWYTTYWNNSAREINVYDASLNLLENALEDWNGSSWSRKKTFKYKYDSQNNKTEDFYYAYNNGTSFTDSLKTIYTYNSNNKVITETHYRIDISHPTWSNETVVNYTYNGNLTEKLIQDWTNNAWVNRIKYTYEYNSNNLLTLETRQNWNSTTNAWKNDRKIKSIYNASNYITDYTTQLFLTSINDWEDYYNTKTTYNSNNQVLSEVQQDMENGQWKDKEKTVNQYNAASSIISSEHSIFTQLNVWDIDKRQTYEYDANNGLQAYNVYTKGFMSDNLNVQVREEYICTQVTSIREVENLSVAIYPNPANSHHITIQSPIAHQYIIVDYLGNQLQLGVLHEGSNTIALPKNMCNGMYFLQIGNSTQKIIINQ